MSIYQLSIQHWLIYIYTHILFASLVFLPWSGSGVTVYALHPGVIHTELGRYVQSRHPVFSTLLYIPALLLLKTPNQGAQTSIYCAVTEGLESYSGCYFRWVYDQILLSAVYENVIFNTYITYSIRMCWIMILFQCCLLRKLYEITISITFISYHIISVYMQQKIAFRAFFSNILLYYTIWYLHVEEANICCKNWWLIIIKMTRTCV